MRNRPAATHHPDEAMRPTRARRKVGRVERETKVELGAIPLVLGVLSAIFLVYAAAV